MLTPQSKLFNKTRKDDPSDAEAVGHKLLVRAGYINQLASGIFSLLPLGYRIHKKVEKIIREEMEAIGGQEVLLPAMQPAALWKKSGRLETMDPPLFRFTDRHKKELVLGPTHEEVIGDLARKYINSYKDLPRALFQIQTKFRNEMRSQGGLLRVREFIMKDLYSFHQSLKDLERYYAEVQSAYRNIFKKCELEVIEAKADSGSIGGSVNHEWHVEANVGEDRVAVCDNCSQSINEETGGESDKCINCGGNISIKNCIECGHTFQLGTKYSKSMQSSFRDKQGELKHVVMGCYGIGLGRLVAAIAEVHNDKSGLAWPESISPFDSHILALQESVFDKACDVAQKWAEKEDVLFDDRDISPGEKFADSDLIGISKQIIVSEKGLKKGKIEIVDRKSGQSRHIDEDKYEPTAS